MPDIAKRAHAVASASLQASLSTFLAHCKPQSYGIGQLAAIMVPHQGFSAAQQAQLCRAVQQPLYFVRVANDCDYLYANNLGAAHAAGYAGAQGVLFCDGDCPRIAIGWPNYWLYLPMAKVATRTFCGYGFVAAGFIRGSAAVVKAKALGGMVAQPLLPLAKLYPPLIRQSMGILDAV